MNRNTFQLKKPKFTQISLSHSKDQAALASTFHRRKLSLKDCTLSHDAKKSPNPVDMKRKNYERSASAQRIERSAKQLLHLQEQARNKFNRLIEEKVTKLKTTN